PEPSIHSLCIRPEIKDSDTPSKLPVPEYTGGRSEKSAFQLPTVCPPRRLPRIFVRETLAFCKFKSVENRLHTVAPTINLSIAIVPVAEVFKKNEFDELDSPKIRYKGSFAASGFSRRFSAAAVTCGECK